FDNVFQINRVDSHRMMIGTGYFGGLAANVQGHLYESLDRGDHLVSLGGISDLNSNTLDDDFDMQTDEGDEFAPAASVGGPINSIAYGGQSGGQDLPAVAYV